CHSLQENAFPWERTRLACLPSRIARFGSQHASRVRSQGRLATWLCCGLRELVFVGKGEFHERMIALNAELLADVGAVGLDGAMADEQFFGDLFARLVFGDQRQHAALGGGEVREAGSVA